MPVPLAPGLLPGCTEAAVASVACGLRHSLALLRGGRGGGAVVVGWGSDRRLQLAGGGGPAAGQPAGEAAAGSEAPPPGGQGGGPRPRARAGVVWEPAALPQPPGSQVGRLLAGGDRSGALLRSGELLLWGRGLGGAPDRGSPTRYLAGGEAGGAGGGGGCGSGGGCREGAPPEQGEGEAGQGGPPAAAWAKVGAPCPLAPPHLLAQAPRAEAPLQLGRPLGGQWGPVGAGRGQWGPVGASGGQWGPVGAAPCSWPGQRRASRGCSAT
jgi:hypothetical protein